MITSIGQCEYDNYFETKWIWQLLWDKVNMITSMRQSEYDN